MKLLCMEITFCYQTFVIFKIKGVAVGSSLAGLTEIVAEGRTLGEKVYCCAKPVCIS